MTAEEMEQGSSYLVVYRRFNGRVNDELIGQYLGATTTGFLFSLRPKAGTTELLEDQVKLVEPTLAPVMLPRRSRRVVTA